MRRADPQRALIRALLARYPELHVRDAASEPWASATFTGMRHVLRCTSMPVAGLGSAEFVLPNHIVADIVAIEDADSLVIEALTIETDEPGTR